MQKHPEAPDRKRSNACAKKNSLGERNSFSFSSDRRSDNARNLSCCWWRAQCVRLLAVRCLTFLRVATVSFTNDPRLKTPNDAPVKIITKTPYNGLNNYN